MIEFRHTSNPRTNTSVDAVIAVATNNGLVDLAGHEFKLLYSRPEARDDHFIARIVAIKDGVIDAKIEPATDGTDQAEAFKALKKDVEVKLDRLLQQVPDRGPATAGPSTGARSSTRTRTSDAPPAYGSTEVDMTPSKGR